MTDRPYDRVTYSGKTLDRITLEALHAAERLLGYPLTVVQGSYNEGGVSASAGTHDGGGVVDLMPNDHERKVRALRRVGFAAWYRPAIAGLWGSHVHAVLIGNKFLAPSAARQVDAYRAHRDGLKSNLPDNTWHPDPIPVFRMPTTALFFPVKHRIVTVNLWVGNKDPLAGINRVIAKVKAAHGFPPDVIACQEAQPHLGKLALVEGYRLLVNRADGEAGLELAVLLRSSLTLLGTEYHHGADGTGTGMYAHERGIFVVKYVKRGRPTAVVNTHMGLFDEAAIADGAAPDAAALDHAEHAAKVARIVTRLRDNGFTVFVTADANARRIERPKSWARALPKVLAGLGLHLTQNGYDLIAHDPVKVNDPAVLLIAHEDTGSDKHDAIAIRCTERKPQ